MLLDFNICNISNLSNICGLLESQARYGVGSLELDSVAVGQGPKINAENWCKVSNQVFATWFTTKG